MKKNIAVAIGGAAGTILRYVVHQLPLPFDELYRPILTILINVSGSFLLGFLTILFAKKFPVSAEVRLGITTGLLGGYTTFSTLCKEAVLLGLSGDIFLSAVYVFASVLLGLAAAWLGIKTAKRMERRRA